MPATELIKSTQQRIFDFIDRQSLPTPYLVIDLQEIANNYQTLRSELPDAVATLIFSIGLFKEDFSLVKLVGLGAIVMGVALLRGS
jgi:hypothetical protein